MKFQEVIPAIKDYPVRQFRRGSTVMYQGEVPRTSYVVKSGAIKTYSINAVGEEQIALFLIEGDVLPAQWTFQLMPHSLYYYEAAVDSELYAVSRDDFLAFIFSSVELAKQATSYYINNYSYALMRINALEQTRAADKILHTLYSLMIRYGKNTGNGMYEIGLPLSHQLLADMVGLTRETTSLELSKLKRAKIISYKGRSYSVNRQAIVSRIGEDNFRDLSV